MSTKLSVQTNLQLLSFIRPILKTFSSIAVLYLLFTDFGYSQNPGFILIKSNPSGAEVFINGKSTSKKTPFQLQLEAGDYKFILQYETYHNFEGDFTIQKGQTVTKDVVLKPAYGNIKIISEPSGADIRLDGVVLNKKTPTTLLNILSGQHNISLSKDMYSDKIEKVTVNDELTTDVFLELQAGYGTLGIVAKPEAIISIDGNMSRSGSYFGRLTPGKHKVIISREKYYTQQQEILLNQGQEEKLNFLLKPIVGSLSVMVDPPESAIYLNSKYYGMSPKILDSLIIGEYDLEIMREGFAIFRKHIVIQENKTIQINNALQQGKLIKVKSDPDGAEVYYNGTLTGKTPTEFVVKDGSNKLILKKKYYADKEVSFTAKKNDEDFTFTLEVNRTKVNVRIETNPSPAGIQMNEKELLTDLSSSLTSNKQSYNGASPYNFQIPLGKYDLVVNKKGFKSLKKEIIVEKELNFNLNLEPAKYRNKGNAMLLSILWPGAGQSYLKRGSALFLMGFVGYGSVAYSLYQHSEAVKNYDLYLAEEDPQKRVSLKSEWQKNLDLSNYSMYAGAAVWGINLIWTLATQSEVKKYKNVQFSLLNTPAGSIPTIGWRSDF